MFAIPRFTFRGSWYRDSRNRGSGRPQRSAKLTRYTRGRGRGGVFICPGLSKRSAALLPWPCPIIVRLSPDHPIGIANWVRDGNTRIERDAQIFTSRTIAATAFAMNLSNFASQSCVLPRVIPFPLSLECAGVDPASLAGGVLGSNVVEVRRATGQSWSKLSAGNV